MLRISLNIKDELVRKYEVINDGPDPKDTDFYFYIVRDENGSYIGSVRHCYADGADRLAIKVLTEFNPITCHGELSERSKKVF